MDKVYVVMIRDVSDFGNAESTVINECAVFTTQEKAKAHLKTVVDGYLADGIKEAVENGDARPDKKYVMTETGDSFTYYEQGSYNTNHIEIWIVEQELNEIFKKDENL